MLGLTQYQPTLGDADPELETSHKPAYDSFQEAIQPSLAKLINTKTTRPSLMPISLDAISMIEILPYYHNDPFDRLRVAQCLEMKIPIISADAVLTKYRVTRIWS